jgi:hypothetical protein
MNASTRRNVLLVQLPIPPLRPDPIRGNAPLAGAYLKLFAEQRGLGRDFAIEPLPAHLANPLAAVVWRGAAREEEMDVHEYAWSG